MINNFIQIWPNSILAAFSSLVMFTMFRGSSANISRDIKLIPALKTGVFFLAAGLIGTAAAYPLYLYVLVPNQLDLYLKLPVLILIPAGINIGLFFLVKKILSKWIPTGWSVLDSVLYWILPNALLWFQLKELNYLESVVYTALSGFSSLVLLVILAGVMERLDLAPVNKNLKGYPVLIACLLFFAMVITSLFRLNLS